MKRWLLLVAAACCCVSAAKAADHIREVQSQLKDQGFYYGEIDGKSSPEFQAAVRRYQIRKGLEVTTGEVNPQVLSSLGLAEGGATRSPAVGRRAAAPDEARPAANLRHDDPLVESDRKALRQEVERPKRQEEPAAESVPAVEEAPVGRYGAIFAGTPYRSAPRDLQVETFLRAQRMLTERGYYRDQPSDRPDAAMEEAILTFQRAARLTLTGRLDLPTLNALNLLPRPAVGTTVMKPFFAPSAN